MENAFDSYAIKTFKVNSTDYLLKPIDNEEHTKVIEKCQQGLKRSHIPQNFNPELNNHFSPPENKVLKRFTVKYGNRMIIIKITLLPLADFDIYISRFRIAGFLKWINA